MAGRRVRRAVAAAVGFLTLAAGLLIAREAMALEFECQSRAELEATIAAAGLQAVYDLDAPESLLWVAEMNARAVYGRYYADRVVLAYNPETDRATILLMLRGCLTAILPTRQGVTEEINDMVLGQRVEQP